ncbi:MAG: hypothetical protein ACPG45_10730 [Flavobacteriaceae bacterium]
MKKKKTKQQSSNLITLAYIFILALAFAYFANSSDATIEADTTKILKRFLHEKEIENCSYVGAKSR